MRESERVIQTAKHFPSLAVGHGSLRKGECNIKGCNLDPHFHKQNPVDKAVTFYDSE